MKLVAFYAILALFATETYSASRPIIARQVAVAVYRLTGFSSTGTPYPYYDVSVPENGVTFPITNPLIVYSIAPIQAFDIPPDYDYPQAICNFTLEDGSTLYDTTSSAQDTDPPQRVIAVACLPSQYSGTNSSIIPSGLYPTGTPYTITYPTAVGTVSSIAPPYPTGTGSYYVPGTTGASASAAPSATGVMPLGRRGVVLLGERSFTGDAGRFTRSLGVSIVALLGVAAGL